MAADSGRKHRLGLKNDFIIFTVGQRYSEAVLKLLQPPNR